VNKSLVCFFDSRYSSSKFSHFVIEYLPWTLKLSAINILSNKWRLGAWQCDTIYRYLICTEYLCDMKCMHAWSVWMWWHVALQWGNILRGAGNRSSHEDDACMVDRKPVNLFRHCFLDYMYVYNELTPLLWFTSTSRGVEDEMETKHHHHHHHHH